MDPTLQAIVNIGAAAGALSAIIGLWVGMVKLWPHVKRFVAIGTVAERLPEMAEEIKAQSETLATIKHELFPNSGLSLRDSTNRQEATLNELKRNLEDHTASCPQQPTTTINVNPGGAP